MHLSRPLFCTLIAAAVVVGTDIDSNDIPTQCQQVCAAVVSLTATCDRKTDDDKQEQDCICKDSQAPTSIPLCEACIAQNSRDGHDNDANDLVRSCSFSTTSYNPAATTTSFNTSSAATHSASSSSTASRSGTTTGTSPARTSDSAGVVLFSPDLGLFGSVIMALFGIMQI
ncbi:hypothetical protein BDV23DRAFT_151026 [Aspergillus alliaceus]|uniref:GPI anchored protein n=1 Tax=Petromyces alliaceus TaxID=209559 RepID=A0A5N7CED4_PETAA|nr:hypothetical protein BDV23DRAFT_151026 [Aspergillus alliaceus]